MKFAIITAAASVAAGVLMPAASASAAAQPNCTNAPASKKVGAYEAKLPNGTYRTDVLKCGTASTKGYRHILARGHIGNGNPVGTGTKTGGDNSASRYFQGWEAFDYSITNTLLHPTGVYSVKSGKYKNEVDETAPFFDCIPGGYQTWTFNVITIANTGEIITAYGNLIKPDVHGKCSA